MAETLAFTLAFKSLWFTDYRSQCLTQMTHSVNPQFAIFDVAGGKPFVLVLLPPLARLFTTNI
ncbi:hypothetical protein LC653_40575 [Nostoc sp. CHAB 5784]|uniref:hypothetical protein n=1 Tax=Nostoc mirabile TaxID=2907820 RepID=UPI001E398371|nr:hypothetical protein [Nostoc mirabile]MCC5669937.1 hypothetical protein [Nostoc mirabile CHAB5784]